MSQDSTTKTAKIITFHCLGCQSTLETMSYADKISLDICSNCHPFYTGKQKLIDTAGRVDRFKSMQQKASMAKEELNKRMSISKTKDKTKDDDINASTTDTESATDAKDISEK